MKNNLPIPRPNPAQALEGLKILVLVWQENQKVQAVERARRTEIKANSKIELERIRSQRTILKKYLKNIFEERELMITGMFDALDKGIEMNNFELIQQSLGSIVAVAKESPLSGIKNLLSDYDNPDVEQITI